jgi:hypothetical protein
VSERERVRRPALDRTTPIRNWATTISTGVPFDGTIGPNVQNANRVVEEYLRAGEASARLFREALGATSANGGSQDIAQRMLRSATDLMSFWIQFMAQWSGGMPPMPPSAGAAATPSPQPAPAVREPAVDRTRVAIEVDSTQPVTVTLDLQPPARGSRLCVDRLHPRRADAPALRGAEIDTSKPDLIVIRLRIEPTQPNDVYNGVILDEASGVPAGTLSVDVSRARQQPLAESGA